MSESQALSLSITTAAAYKVQSLIHEEENPDLCLRVFVIGGGCSGFQYGFSFDEVIKDDDIVIKKTIVFSSEDEASEDGGGGETSGNGEAGQSVCVSVLVDPLSIHYLKGAEIDYRDDIQGEQFIIKNPNAKTTCGCGSSFSA